MRRTNTTLAIALCASALLGGAARASDTPKDKGSFDTAGATAQPATDNTNFGSTAASRLTGGVGDDDVGGLLDHVPGRRGKWFDVGGTFETHALLWQDNTNAGNKKLFNFAYFYASLNLSRNDRIRIRGGFYEYLLADPNENGVRATDLSLSYSHAFRLPDGFVIRAAVALTAPISFYSQLAGEITAPTASIAITKGFAAGLSLDLNAFGGTYIQKYASSGGYNSNVTTPNGGNPNPLAIVGGSIEADYAFWFHHALSIGADGYLAWLWSRDIDGSAPLAGNYYGYGVGNTPGVVGDATYKHQPVQQLYGFEVFLRYSFPNFHGIHADLLAAIAEGDPTLGYVSRNIDGISHFFDDYYQNFEVYGAVSLRY